MQAVAREVPSGRVAVPRPEATVEPSSELLCPSCARVLPTTYRVCPHDGTPLEPRSSPQDPLIGVVVAQTYRIVRFLARGGMGRLYEAEHVRLGRRVSLKVMHEHFAANPDLVVRFEREARAASRIRHPNVLEVLDVVRTPCGRPSIVAEYLEGHDLQAELDRVDRLPIEEALGWARDLARGLAAAHAAGVIHRDIKPSNVFLSETARGRTLKVLDFGVAKLAGDDKLTRTGAVVGTPAYMAPEQARGAALAEPRSDVYAVGALLYRMTTGFTPYEPGDPSTTLSRVLSEEPRRPRDLAPELPLAVEALVQRAMARDPELRIPSMEALASALDELARERAPESPVGATTHALVRDARASRPLAVAAVALASSVAGLGAAAILGGLIPHPGTDEGRLLVIFSGVVACLGVAVPLARDLHARWQSAPACLDEARRIGLALLVAVVTIGGLEVLSAGAAALCGEPSSRWLGTRMVLGALASGLAFSLGRRARASAAAR